MSGKFERSYCVYCMTWVHPDDHIRWEDPDTGKIIQKCRFCIDGVEAPKEFIRDPRLCPWCDSDKSEYLGYENGCMKRRCHDCGDEFYAT
jgi:hypothetical protein